MGERDEFRFKIVTDPVHGDIGLSKLEVQLIDCPSFQRLRRIKQLGLASYVYPSATHSRFSHSLGVFHIMSRIIDLLVRQGKLEKLDRQKLRVAALLHDIGHYPYSHLLEKLDQDKTRSVWLLGKRSNGPAELGAQVPYPDHEKLARVIITSRTDLTEPLREAKLDPREVAAIVGGEHSNPVYNQLIHSSLDVDRMDYLIRDAIHTGVPYGRIDINYLLNNLQVVEQEVVLSEKAATAADHFLLARFFMSKAVYMHKTVFAFEALVRSVLFLLRAQGKLPADGAQIEKIVGSEEFTGFHDGYVDQRIDQVADADEVGTLARMCRAIKYRTPPRLVKEIRRLTPANEPHADIAVFKKMREAGLRELAKKHGIPVEFWLLEDPGDLGFEKLGPFIPLGRAQEVKEEETAELIRIADREGDVQLLVAQEDSVIHHLSKLRLQVARLYVLLEDPPEEAERRLVSITADVEEWLRES